MRVVFDTNVFVSAFVIPGSQSEATLGLARRRQCELCTSVPILTETARILRRKFGQEDGDVRRALRLIGRVSTVVRPVVALAVLDDEPDNRILECAAESRADVVVTGDRHLLRLRRFEGVSIVRLADFLRMLPPAALL